MTQGTIQGQLKELNGDLYAWIHYEWVIVARDMSAREFTWIAMGLSKEERLQQEVIYQGKLLADFRRKVFPLPQGEKVPVDQAMLDEYERETR